MINLALIFHASFAPILDRTGALDCPATIRRARCDDSRPLPRVRGLRWFARVAALVALLHVGCSLVRSDLPPLRESIPRDGELGFPLSGWIILDFAEAVRERAIDRIELSCGGAPQAMRVHRVTPTRLALDPVGEFDTASRCETSWTQSGVRERIRFTTGAPILPAQIPYDREDLRQVAPYPDDYWLVANPSDPTEHRLRIQMSGFWRTARWLMNALVSGVREFDGFSPIAHITIPLSVPADPDSLPRTPEQSLDPLASIGLFDVTPGSADYASRIPFRLDARTETTRGQEEHALLLFPSVALKPRHRYGVIVTRRALSHTGSPYDPSAFFEAVRDGSSGLDSSWAVKRARKLVDEVLVAVSSGPIAIERADVAFAVRFTVRNLDGIADDLSAIRKLTAAGPPPAIEITRVDAESSHATRENGVAAVVHGTWTAPDWRDSDRWLARDPNSGTPVQTGLQVLPFTLALPRAAYRGAVPVVMYQHGNPGSAREEVVDIARDSLAAAGFAVIGFTDVTNREVSPPGSPVGARARWQMTNVLLRLMGTSRFPDDFVLTVSEQLAFLRAIQSVAEIPSFALEAPGANQAARTQGIDVPGADEPARTPAIDVPGGDQPGRIYGIDARRPLSYLGISEGAHLGSLLLPFAPEIRAAALISPGRRFSEILIHQGSERLRGSLAFLGFRGFSPIDVWVALALVQQIFDDQDPHHYARFLYREPLEIDPPQRASVLVVEGLNDSLIPNHATRSWVRELGPIPRLGEPGREIFGFERVENAVSGNIDSRTTAAFYQFVPRGVEGAEPTPGCNDPALAESSAREGHYCAQSAEESLRQRVHFFETALGEDAPEIIDPLTQ
jgi:hypothetical protein